MALPPKPPQRPAPSPGRSAPPPSRPGAAPARAAQAPPRPSPPPSRPGAAPARAELAERAQAMARSLVESFRRSDKFFKMRAGIVGTWLLLSIVTLWAACPSSGPTNPLGADVRVLDSAVGGQQLLIRNESTDNWTEVVLTLDGGWRSEAKTVRPHDQLVLSMSHFRQEGRVAPRDLKPRRLVVECDQGRAAIDLK